METRGWVTMVVILTIVWGGAAILALKALRAESRKGPDITSP